MTWEWVSRVAYRPPVARGVNAIYRVQTRCPRDAGRVWLVLVFAGRVACSEDFAYTKSPATQQAMQSLVSRCTRQLCVVMSGECYAKIVARPRIGRDKTNRNCYRCQADDTTDSWRGACTRKTTISVCVRLMPSYRQRSSADDQARIRRLAKAMPALWWPVRVTCQET